MYIQIVDMSVRWEDLAIGQVTSVPSRYLHFNCTATAIVQHEQSILGRTRAWSKIELQHHAAEIDISYGMIAMEVYVLAWNLP